MDAEDLEASVEASADSGTETKHAVGGKVRIIMYDVLNIEDLSKQDILGACRGVFRAVFIYIPSVYIIVPAVFIISPTVFVLTQMAPHTMLKPLYINIH